MQQVLPMRIGGQAVVTDSPRAVQMPYDGSTIATVFEGGREHVEAAVGSARAAAAVMREMTRDQRSAILRRAHALLLERRDAIAFAIVSECGKPIREARAEVARASYTLLFSAEEAHRLGGEVVPMDAEPAGQGYFGMVVREPVGVVAAITPFNFPLNLAMHKIGPALAGGNAVVHKPASATPVSALLMAELFAEAGLPPGALNVVTGPGGAVGEALVEHPGINMVTFTGSVDVGGRLRAIAGLKRVTLELGSNSAVIVEDDADLEEAAARCVAGAFAHSGQVCISVQRVYVHERVAREFTDRVVEATRKLSIGDPRDVATDVSSLITPGEAERIDAWIGSAIAGGARLLTGGARSHRATVEPAVLTGVAESDPIMRREAFGPVVGINPYATLDEAIGLVNDSDYGLQAGIYTRDLQKAFSAARRVHVGGFMINEVPQFRVDQMPYGGVKQSGSGREGPRYAIEEMTEPKLIVWKA